MSTHGGRSGSADVLILAAISLEYEVVRLVDAGAVEGGQWEEERRPNGLWVAFRSFHGKKGSRPLRVALGLSRAVGTVGTITALLPLVEEYLPRCIAMCGVYPDRPENSNLGDVIVPDKLLFHDVGKRYPNIVRQDLMTYNLRDDWKEALNHFDFLGHLKDQDWWKNRPVPFHWQKHWLLMKLHEGVSAPWTLPEGALYCPDGERVFDTLVSYILINRSGKLTPKGRERVKALSRYKEHSPDLFPTGEQLPFRVHLASINSDSDGIPDLAHWGDATGYMSKALGLQREAATLDALVMKGVMGMETGDPFRKYVARTSAECLIAFLREHLAVS